MLSKNPTSKTVSEASALLSLMGGPSSEVKKTLDRLMDYALRNEAAVDVLKQEKKITEEDIKHMVRIKEEKLAIQAEREALERDREKEQAIAAVKDEYRNKLEQRLQTEVDNIRQMYSEILERLPKVSVRQLDHYETTERKA